MKLCYSLISILCTLLVSSCSATNTSNFDNNSVNNVINNSDNNSTSTNTSTNTNNNNTSANGGNNSSNSSNQSTTNDNKPKKVTVVAHTLKDLNPPINVNSNGQVVNEDTWDSFRNASNSKFNNNYNYTYTTYSGGYYTIQKFTKNGYYLSSINGSLYYERKSGSIFYNYISTKDGYLRQETTLDIQNKYTSIIQNEIYTHMFDFENYEYDAFDGTYRYYGTGFAAAVKFQSNYLVYLYYIIGMNVFEIKSSFETTIEIPESYYIE